MGAEELREAATRLRALAEAATPGPWLAVREPGVGHVVTGDMVWVAVLGNEEGNDTDAALIAAIGPTFALAVADSLENAAEDAEMQGPGGALRPRWDIRVEIATARALAVARAFLGAST